MAEKIKNLDKLFMHQLKDLYDVENQILKALPKMIKKTSSSELKQAFKSHLKETEKQKQRLEQSFQELGSKASATKCAGIRGIIEEGEDLMKELDAAAMDAGLVTSAQRVEHYEMAAYGSARAYAQQLGHAKIANLLQESLDEEMATDKKLTTIAEKQLNQRAKAAT